MEIFFIFFCRINRRREEKIVNEVAKFDFVIFESLLIKSKAVFKLRLFSKKNFDYGEKELPREEK